MRIAGKLARILRGSFVIIGVILVPHLRSLGRFGLWGVNEIHGSAVSWGARPMPNVVIRYYKILLVVKTDDGRNNAARLCDAYSAAITQVDGDRLSLVAHHGPIPTTAPVGQATLPLVRGTALARAVLDRQTIHVADAQAETGEYPQGSDMAHRLGIRAVLHQPLIRAGTAIGGISIRRADVRPFTDRQIELLKTFADQAVIAIENSRLFEAEQASKRELTEALEQQTATADVLKVISRSALNVQKVLDALIESAARLCNAYDAAIFQVIGDSLRLVAYKGQWCEQVECARSLVRYVALRESKIGMIAAHTLTQRPQRPERVFRAGLSAPERWRF